MEPAPGRLAEPATARSAASSSALHQGTLMDHITDLALLLGVIVIIATRFVAVSLTDDDATGR